MPGLFVLPLRLQSHLVVLEPFRSRLGFLNSFYVASVFRSHLMSEKEFGERVSRGHPSLAGRCLPSLDPQILRGLLGCGL